MTLAPKSYEEPPSLDSSELGKLMDAPPPSQPASRTFTKNNVKKARRRPGKKRGLPSNSIDVLADVKLLWLLGAQCAKVEEEFCLDSVQVRSEGELMK